MFIENFAINLLGVIIFMAIGLSLLNWFCEEMLNILAMDSYDWLAVGAIFLVVALISL